MRIPLHTYKFYDERKDLGYQVQAVDVITAKTAILATGVDRHDLKYIDVDINTGWKEVQSQTITIEA